MFVSTKYYGHDRGYSVCFRQWRAPSHCNQLHGYALAFEFTFEADDLDELNWVVDYGSVGRMKPWLEQNFDHSTVVAADDPERAWFEDGARRKIMRLIVLPSLSCERFAEYTFNRVYQWLEDSGYTPRVRLRCVKVWEHGGNSAWFEG